MFLVSFSVLSISVNTISFVVYPIVLREKVGNASRVQAFTQQSPSCWWLLLEAWRQVELNALRFCKNDSNLRDVFLPLIKKRMSCLMELWKERVHPLGVYLWVGFFFLCDRVWWRIGEEIHGYLILDKAFGYKTKWIRQQPSHIRTQSDTVCPCIHLHFWASLVR